MINNAVILPVITPTSLEFGGMTTVDKTLIFPDGDALPFLPLFETQSNTYFDSWGCVSHSFQNACEAYLKARYVEDHNFSDRDLVVLSGTKPGIGNSGEKVLATVQERGMIPQALADWGPTNRDPKINIQEVYYNYIRSKAGEAAAEEFKRTRDVVGEWVARENWKEASKYGALQVYVNAWHLKDGKYYNPNGKHNHAVMMANYKDVKIFDTYKPEIKTLSSWSDAYYWALKINIIKKHMDKPLIINNTLVQLVEGEGGFGLYLDGKIIVDDLAKVIASWILRNNGKLDGKTKALTDAQWRLFDRVNLKMQKV